MALIRIHLGTFWWFIFTLVSMVNGKENKEWPLLLSVTLHWKMQRSIVPTEIHRWSGINRHICLLYLYYRLCLCFSAVQMFNSLFILIEVKDLYFYLMLVGFQSGFSTKTRSNQTPMRAMRMLAQSFCSPDSALFYWQKQSSVGHAGDLCWLNIFITVASYFDYYICLF